MEAAKITEATEAQQEQVQPQQSISLVTEDDLQLEIGRWVVSGINKSKMIDRAVAQITHLSQLVISSGESVEKAVETEKSNKKLAEKNKSLNDAAEIMKAEVKEVLQNLGRVQSNLDGARKQLDESMRAISKKDEEIVTLRDRVATLKSKKPATTRKTRKVS